MFLKSAISKENNFWKADFEKMLHAKNVLIQFTPINALISPFTSNFEKHDF